MAAGPARDVVLAFTADEEDTAEAGLGLAGPAPPDLFEGCTEGISESGAYTFHAGGGVRIYPVGAGERGTAWLKLTAAGRAGHGSRVNRDNAVGGAGRRRRPDLRAPVAGAAHAHGARAALSGIGAAVGEEIDPDQPDFDVDAALERLGPAAQLVAATVRNSANPTMLDAGYKVNVIPGSATARVDGRVLPGGETEFESTARRAHRRPRRRGTTCIARCRSRRRPTGPPSPRCRSALLAEDPGAHVVPVCLAGGTDAKQFSRLGITGYGFAPLRLPAGFDYSAAFHGVDERVPVDGLEFGVRVLDRFLESC